VTQEATNARKVASLRCYYSFGTVRTSRPAETTTSKTVRATIIMSTLLPVNSNGGWAFDFLDREGQNGAWRENTIKNDLA